MTIWSSSQGSAMNCSEEFRRDTVFQKRKPKIKLTTGIRVLLKSQRLTRSTSVRPAEHADLGHAGSVTELRASDGTNLGTFSVGATPRGREPASQITGK